jgi:hypothetical protein
MGVAGLNSERAVGGRKTLRRAIEFGVRTRGREDETRAIFVRHAAGSPSGNGGTAGGGGNQAPERCPTRNSGP